MEFQITCESGFGRSAFDQFMVQGYCEQTSSSKTFVLDCERGELVKATTGAVVGKKSVSLVKSPEALKIHSDAERRRRERINAHITTLRGLLPSSTDKMDKAAILAEVITQVRKLKKRAVNEAAGLIIPLDTDEVRVQPVEDHVDEGTLRFKVSICCSYRPGLLSELKMSLNGLQLHTEQAELSTLGGRVKNVFVLSIPIDGNVAKKDAENALASTIHRAFTLVLHKAMPLQAYSPQTDTQNKKQKLS